MIYTWRMNDKREVSNWLNKIDDTNRYHYLTSVEQVDESLTRIEKWLSTIEEDIYQLIHCRKYQIGEERVILLYFLLSDIKEEILLRKSSEIKAFLHDFYHQMSEQKRKDFSSFVHETKVQMNRFTNGI